MYSRLIAAFGLLLLLYTQTARADIVANFTEVGDDVLVTFDGTIDLDPLLADDTFPSSSGISSYAVHYNRIHFRAPNSPWYQSSAGTHVEWVPPASGSSGVGFSIGGNGHVFGYDRDMLIWDSSAISGGSIGAVSQLTVNATDYNFTIPNHDFDSLRIRDVAQNTVVWEAATTGDRILFTSTTAVPEPSSAILLACASMFPLWRSRRRRPPVWQS